MSPPAQNRTLADAQAALLAELIAAGHYVPLGVPGLYGRSGALEGVIESFEQLVTRAGTDQNPEVIRFPPVFSRTAYERTDHMESMPHLLGAIRSFDGDHGAHSASVPKSIPGEDWTSALSPTDLMMVPAACYPLYPTATGQLPEGGRVVDLRTWVFRREPSADPARMQAFRQREFVRLGSPEEAVAHRDEWLSLAQEIHVSLGLHVRRQLANDPFFGRGGRVMKATQREQDLKYELVLPITSDEHPTAITSSNCHLDHFGAAFDIQTSDGVTAHTSCVGFGLERVALALLKTHGMDPDHWPKEVRAELRL